MSASTALIFNVFARNHTGPGLNAVSGGFKKLTRGLIGVAGFAGVTAAIGQSINKAANFDKTIRLAGVTANASAAQMKGLSDYALKVGTNSQFGAQGAADAMLELSKGGITIAQMKMGALAGTMTLASAGGMELGAASTVVVNALAQFGLKASQASTIAAALAGGANASTASVESLAEGLGNVGAVAHGAGMSIQATTAILSEFDQGGIKGAEGGTQLKTMLLRLQVPTNSAAKKIAAMGLSFRDSTGHMKPMTAIADQLKAKLGGMGKAQQDAALQTIFGKYAISGARIVMQGGSKALKEYTKATSDQKAAQKLAAAQTAGAAGSFKKFHSAVETLQISFALHLLPAVTVVVTWLTTLTNKITAGIGPAFAWLSSKIKENKGHIDGARSNLVLLGAWIHNVGIPAISKFAKRFWVDLQPSLKAIAAAWREDLKPALASAIAKFRESWPTIQRVAKILGRVAEIIMTKVMPVLYRLEGKYLAAVIRILGVVWVTVWKVIGVFVSFVTHLVHAGQAIGRFASKVGDAMSRAWSAVKNGVSNAVSTIKGMPGRAVAAVGDLGRLLYQKGLDFIQGFINGIADKAKSIPGVIKDKVIGAAQSAIHGFGLFGSPSKLTYKYGAWFGQGFINGILGTTSRITSTFASLVDKLKNAGLKSSATAAMAFEHQMLTLAKRRDKIEAKIKASKLNQIRKDAADYAKTIRESFVSSGDVSSLAEEGGTFDGLIAKMATARDQARSFTEGIAKLRKEGLNGTTIAQLVAAGPTGGLGAVQQLLSGGRGGIGQVNSLLGQIDAQGSWLGGTQSHSVYAAPEHRALAEMHRLQREDRKIMRQMVKVAKRTIKVELNLTGADDDLLRRLRKQVRIHGGVEKALGGAR